MTYYSLRSNVPYTPELPYIITKFDKDLNVESTYFTGNVACECPAGVRETCRHRQMLPTLAPRVDTAWFYCFETKSWEDPTGQAELDEGLVSSPNEPALRGNEASQDQPAPAPQAVEGFRRRI